MKRFKVTTKKHRAMWTETHSSKSVILWMSQLMTLWSRRSVWIVFERLTRAQHWSFFPKGNRVCVYFSWGTFRMFKSGLLFCPDRAISLILTLTVFQAAVARHLFQISWSGWQTNIVRTEGSSRDDLLGAAAKGTSRERWWNEIIGGLWYPPGLEPTLACL